MSYGATPPPPGYPGAGYPGPAKPGYSPAAPPPKQGGSSTLIIVLAILGVGAVACVCFGAILAALLLPAVSPARIAARQSASRDQLKQIGVALQNYHDAYNSFPAAYYADEDGKPRTSWRACLLPYLEEQSKFNAYNFNVPWNAPENAAVAQSPITVYQSPAEHRSPSLKTAFVVVTGPGTAFPGAESTRLSQILDGTSNTIFVLEIKNSNIDWAEPRDLDIDSLSTDPTAPNCIDLAGGALAVLGDGQVVRLPSDLPLQTLKDYLTVSDGRVTPPLGF